MSVPSGLLAIDNNDRCDLYLDTERRRWMLHCITPAPASHRHRLTSRWTAERMCY